METFTAGDILVKGNLNFFISVLTHLNSLEGLTGNRLSWALFSVLLRKASRNHWGGSLF